MLPTITPSINEHRATTADYTARAEEIRAAMLGLAQRFGDLVDEAVALTRAATALDKHSAELARLAHAAGDPVPAFPVVTEDVVHALRSDPAYGMHLTRLWHAGFRGRRPTGVALAELFDAIERST